MPEAQKAAFGTVLRGLRHMAPSSTQAAQWLEVLAPFATRSAGIEIADSGSAALHPILPVLCDQPAVSFPTAVQAECCAIGARVFLAVALELVDIPASFAHGLRQLYRNKQQTWERLREELVSQEPVQIIPSWDREGSATATFRVSVRRIQQGELPPPRASWLQGGTAAPTAVALPEAVATVPRAESKEEIDVVEPAFDLFQQQIRRSMDGDLVDGNRLSIHWGRLHAKEVKAVFRILRRDLDGQESPYPSKGAVYAAMRILSFESGISMRLCFRMPFNGQGDLHLDLTSGCLLRDWSVAARRLKPLGDDTERPASWTPVPLFNGALRVFRDLRGRHPSATSVGQMVQAEGITLRAMGQSLNADWPTSHRPEDARFAISWRQVLLELGVHPAVIVRVTGDVMTTPVVDEFYRAVHDDWIDDALKKTCEWAEMDAPSMPFPRLLRGSPKYIAADELRALFADLDRRVRIAQAQITTRSDINQVIAFHNLYVTAVALLLQWAYGTRCTKLERQTVEAILVSTDYMAISDKKTDLYGAVRIVPKTPVIAGLLNNLVEHTLAVARRLKKANHPAARQLARVAGGELPQSPAFLLLESADSNNNRGCRNLSRKDLVALAEDLFASCGYAFEQGDLNRPRHFFYTEAVARNISQLAIDSLLGHHTVGAETHGFFSGISLREVAQYLRPRLTEIHADLQVSALIGLGRRAQRFLRPPKIGTPRQLAPLPNSYLQRKIRDDEELAQDHFAREQDPPFTLQTLLAHARLSELRAKYLTSGILRSRPAGALYFCLIVYDAVLTQKELDILYAALRRPPARVGEHVLVEAGDQWRPSLQRSLSVESLLAWRNAHDASQGLGSPPAASTELHELLKSLDASWPSQSPSESVRLLCTLAAHWSAIEVAPGTMFCAHHKAPFIPAAHAARIFLGRPCLPSPEVDAPTRTAGVRRGSDFNEILKVVHKWAAKDAGLGEAETLRLECTRELLQLAQDGSFDVFDLRLIGQFVADMSERPPYERLKVSTLSSRAGKYATVYGYFRRERTFELDPDSVQEAFAAIGGDEFSNSDVPRWVLLHIGPYLSTQGYRPCFAPFLTKGQMSNRAPRNPVYTTLQEVQLVSQRLEVRYAHSTNICERASVRPMFERVVPSRRSDIRFARVQDLDEQAGLIHFTTSGHAHLKGDSHGSLVVPPVVLEEVVLLKRLVLELGQGKGAALFADSQDEMVYDQFDALSDAIREEVILVTGCSDFRRHDFRAAALTDECLSHVGSVRRMLEAPWRRDISCAHTREELEYKYTRFLRASAAARHTSGHTALRYYNVGGILDLRRELDCAGSSLAVGATYLAAAALTSRQAVYAQKHRAVSRGDNTSGIARLEEVRTATLDALPQPALGEPVAESHVVPPCVAPSAKLIEGLILLSLGASIAAASIASGLSRDLLKHAQSRIFGVAAGLRSNIEPTSALKVFQRTAVFRGHSRAQIVRAYARWLDDRKDVCQASAALLASAVDRKGQAFRFQDFEQLIEVIRLLDGVSEVGLRPVISLRDPKTLPFGLASAAKSAGVDIAQEETRSGCIATIHFVNFDVARPPVLSLRDISARSLGIAGRMAITGLLAAITV